ncbi:hypothetical protein TBR22_A25640 [Luteitalea sp. TBR-22]|nr:hypothetical protein TBR22_A25640 [Luteitalea sp. TBR-22]
MLRGNLATRPFYNERAVQAVLATLAIGLGLLSLLTVWQLVSLTGQQRELAARIARDEGRAAALRGEAQQVRSRLDAVRLDATIKAAREANAVIDARTFSWTALFNVIERTIPADVRLQAVTPSLERDALMVRLVVNTRRVEPVGTFMDRLEAAGAFRGLQSVEEQLLEDGTYNVVCIGEYLGPGAPAPTPESAPAAAPAAAGAN